MRGGTVAVRLSHKQKVGGSSPSPAIYWNIMNIPILIKHDQEQEVGQVYTKDGGLYFEFPKDSKISRDRFFSTFGVGFAVIDANYGAENDEFWIIKGRIYEFSLDCLHDPEEQW